MTHPADPPAKTAARLDAMAQRFLGNQIDEVRVIAGQQATEKRLLAAQEKYLVAEACQFGDILVRYTMGHRKLSFEQRAWGFTLALFCIREDYPEGVEEFDTVVDQAGSDLELSMKNVVTDPEQITRVVSDLVQFDTEQFKGAAIFAEQLSRYVEGKKHQKNLSNPQAAYGLGRAFHNLRLGYPLSEGGPAVFDELTRRAGEYFERYK